MHRLAHHVLSDTAIVIAVCVAPSHIVLSLDDQTIHVHTATGQPQRVLKCHAANAWCLAVQDGSLLSGHMDGSVQVWSLQTGESLRTMTGHTATVRGVKFLGAHAAVSASRDATLRTWDLATGASTATLAGHEKSVTSVALRGDVAVSGSDDGVVRIWSLSGQSCLAACAGHTAEVRAVAIADDGSRIFSGSRDGHVRVWGPTGACVAVLQGHSSLVSHVRVHGDSLVTAGADGQIRVWSAKSLLLKYAVRATDFSITSLDIFENRVLSGQSDGLVRLWDFETGAALGCVGGKSEAVWHTESSNGGATIVVAARENDASTLSLWQL